MHVLTANLRRGADNQALVLLCGESRDFNLSAQMSPDGLRSLARAILQAAREIEVLANTDMVCTSFPHVIALDAAR